MKLSHFPRPVRHSPRSPRGNGPKIKPPSLPPSLLNETFLIIFGLNRFRVFPPSELATRGKSSCLVGGMHSPRDILFWNSSWSGLGFRYILYSKVGRRGKMEGRQTNSNRESPYHAGCHLFMILLRVREHWLWHILNAFCPQQCDLGGGQD